MRMVILFCAALIMLFSAGCISHEKSTPEIKLRDFSGNDDPAAMEIAGNFAGGFAKSLETGDFSFWQKQFAPGNTSGITPAKFAAMRRELTGIFGEFRGSRFMGILITGNQRNYLWKLTFDRDTSAGKRVYEMVFSVRIFCEEGKAPAVSGFGVKRF